MGPISQRWAKEAINICTGMLGEQQKISILSEILTTLTYQPQEALGDEINYKDQLKQMVEQLTFEVEQKELYVLAAPTRLQEKKLAVEQVFNKYKDELRDLEEGFKEP